MVFCSSWLGFHVYYSHQSYFILPCNQLSFCAVDSFTSCFNLLLTLLSALFRTCSLLTLVAFAKAVVTFLIFIFSVPEMSLFLLRLPLIVCHCKEINFYKQACNTNHWWLHLCLSHLPSMPVT